MLLNPESYYHIYNRGNNKEILFKEARNYRYFLSLWRQHLAPVLDTFAYSLLPNHFHFVVRVKPAPYGYPGDFQRHVSRRFANHFAAYALAINKQYGRVGSLFQKNFRRREITSDAYLGRLILYVHTNAQKHELVGSFLDHAHHSFHSLLSDRHTLLMREEVLGMFGGREPFINAHLEYSSWLEDEYYLLKDAGDD